jgi:hypothetical protein
MVLKIRDFVYNTLNHFRKKIQTRDHSRSSADTSQLTCQEN